MSDRIDVEKQRLCSYLLPDPGGEAMRGLLDAYASLRAENERLRGIEIRADENGNVDEFVGWSHIERMDEHHLCLTAAGGVVYDLVAEKGGVLTIYCVDKGRVASKEQES